jgi:molybdate transport system substrate-binding protein
MRVLIVALMLSLTAKASAADVVVAAASDLTAAMGDIVAAFEKSTGHDVKLTLGSSGSFYAQIRNGAPFDVFLSADLNYVRELEKAGHAEAGTSDVYAVGHLVLWVSKNSVVPIETQGLNALLDPRIKRIAIANPANAPYGRAAVEAMKKAGIYETARSKFVLGENISQTAQFVQSGAADIGIVALSLALSDSMKGHGKYWDIPLDNYPRLDQGGVILRHAEKSGHREAALAFMRFLRSDQGKAILRRFGFDVK